jgi:hypothetical protein
MRSRAALAPLLRATDRDCPLPSPALLLPSFLTLLILVGISIMAGDIRPTKRDR